MPDFSKIEEQLNKDPQLQQRFLKDPVAVLKQEGVELSADQQKQVRTLVEEMGSSERLVGSKPRISISIGIRIRF